MQMHCNCSIITILLRKNALLSLLTQAAINGHHVQRSHVSCVLLLPIPLSQRVGRGATGAVNVCKCIQPQRLVSMCRPRHDKQGCDSSVCATLATVTTPREGKCNQIRFY